MEKEIIVYKALDFLFCDPDKPEYEELIDKNGFCYGYKITNLINVCNQHSFVTARKPTEQEPYYYVGSVVLVYGKYPVPEFLLEPVGKLILK